MVTRRSTRTAGALAVATAITLGVSVFLFDGGPPVAHAAVVQQWFVDHAVAVRASALAGFAAMVGLAAFSIAFRESMWAVIADRTWTTLVVLQGAAVFGVVAIVSAGIVWSLADQAAAGRLTAASAGSLWPLAHTLFRFATWGLVVPVVFTAPALQRQSLIGQVAAVLGLLVAVAVVVPITPAVAVYGFAGWLGLSGISLTLPLRTPVTEPQYPVART